ncbi:metallophosphoesterase family protein [Cetobacterium somerae]|uniref:metallophosphoesterase family protein n=1 Tax=Cetobacterium somerae TaxID=188913 RepID=UPI0038926DA2
MALPFDIKDIDFILKFSSGNIGNLLGSQKPISKMSTEELSKKKLIINNVIKNLNMIEDTLSWRLNSDFSIFFKSSLDLLLNDNLSIYKKEQLIKKIIRMFTKFFPLKIFILPGTNDNYTSLTFFYEFVSRINHKNLLILQCKNSIPKDVKISEALYKYKDLFLNIHNNPGLFFFNRDHGFFLPIGNNSMDEICYFIEKYFSIPLDNLTLDNYPHYRSYEQKINLLMYDAKKNCPKPDKEITIFHLSDLHLGYIGIKDHDIKNLLRHIRADMGSKNLFFITGDLIDNPDPTFLVQLNSFLNKLQALDKNNKIFLVNGNHDFKFWGNFEIFNAPLLINRSNALQNFYLDLKNTINYDHNVILIQEYNILLIKIDSCKESAHSARGYIGTKQLNALSQQISNYSSSLTKIVLLHHHPITNNFENPLIKLIDSNDFLDWVQKHNINYVCHGHNHVHNITNVRNTTVYSANTALRDSVSINYNLMKLDLNSNTIINGIHLTYQKESHIRISRFRETFSYASYFFNAMRQR